MKRHIPNILTGGRLVLSLVMFGVLVLMAWRLQGVGRLDSTEFRLYAHTAFIAFAVAAVSDFFDGMLARRWQVVSIAGAILDPIADKILVCAAILALMGLGIPGVLLPGAIILFREFAVSALREVLAPRGLKLPVTFLAKTKTALQLVALGLFLALLAGSTWGSEALEKVGSTLLTVAQGMFWLAALITAWTGVEYGLAARKALKAAG